MKHLERRSAECLSEFSTRSKVKIRSCYSTQSCYDHGPLNPDSLMQGCARTVMFVLLLFGSTLSKAADVHWINPAGGDWSDELSWSGLTIPLPADNVFIDTAGTYSVLLNYGPSLESIIIGGASGVQTLRWTNAAISPITLSSEITVVTNGVFDIAGRSGSTVTLDGFLTNHGTLLWSGGQFVLGPGTSLINGVDGWFEIKSNSNLAGQSDAVLENAGVIEYTGTQATSISIHLNNSGLIHAMSGGLQFNRGSGLNGTFTADAGAEIQFKGDYILDHMPVFTGSGTINFGPFATIGFTVPITQFRLNGGTLVGSNTVDGSLTWTEGNIQGSVVVSTNSTLSIRTTASRQLLGELQNYGTIIWTNGQVALGNDSKIRNEEGGVIEIASNLALGSGSGSILRNAGTLRRSGNSQTTLIQTYLNNLGLVHAQAGKIWFSAGGLLQGTFTADADAEIIFNDGAFTLDGPQFNGPGTIRFGDGAVVGFKQPITEFSLNTGTLYGTNEVTGTLDWTGGVVSGRLIIATNGVLNISGAADKTLVGVIENHGTINWTGGHMHLNAGSFIENTQNGIFEARAEANLYGTGGNVFLNRGALQRLGTSGTTVINVFLENEGLVEGVGGTLRFSAGSDAEGTFYAHTGASVLLSDGTFVLDGTPSFTGPGTIDFGPGANISFTTPIEDFTLNSSTLSGTNEVTGILEWTGGVISGRLIISTNGVLNISSVADKTLVGVIENHGTINWTGGHMHLNAGSYIENTENGIFEARAEANLYGTGGNVFLNRGALQRLGTSGTTVINIFLENEGLVEGVGGTLRFSAGSDAEGTFYAHAGASVLLSDGTFVVDGTPSFTGPGTVDFGTGANISFTTPIEDFTLNSSTLSGTNEVTGTLEWTGGVVSGRLIIATNGVLNISGVADKTLVGVIENHGTINWTGGHMHLNAGSYIENTENGIFEARAEANLYGTGGTVFLNRGTLRRTGANTVTTIQVPLENLGLIELFQGTLRFAAAMNLDSGALRFVLDGPIAGTDHGIIDFPGHVVLGGELQVATTASFIPIVGQKFEILKFVSRSSGFLRSSGLELSGDPFLRVENTDQALSLVTASFLGVPPPPATNLVDQVVAVGRPITFRIEPLGAAPFTYQWQFNANNIPLATNSSFTINSAQSAHAGLYTVRVKDNLSTTIAYSATLRVLLPPTITEQPASQTAAINSSVTLNAGYGGEGPHSYQWRLNGANIPGATNDSFTISPVQPTSGGSYSVTFANPVGAVRSALATVIVDAPDLDFSDNFAGSPQMTSPSGFGRGNNTNATKEPDEPNHADKIGGRSVWIAWRAPANGIAKFSTRGSSFDTLAGVYTEIPELGLLKVASDDDRGGFFTSEVAFQATSGSTYLIAIDGFGGTSGNISLSWELDSTIGPIPKIIAHPANRRVSAGANVSFRVDAISTGTLNYQWLFNEYLRLEGATNPTLILQNVQTSDAGRYSVEISNQNGVLVRSEAATLEISTDARSFSEDKFRDLFDPLPLGLGNFKAQAAAAGFPSVSAGTLGTQILNNFNSTVELGEPLHGSVIGGSSRWFILKALENGTMVVDTVGSAIDTVLAIYTGSDIFTLHEIASDNDSAFDGIRSRVRFDALAGTEYLVAVDGVKGAQGDLVLNWGMGETPQLGTPPTPQTVAPGGTARFEVHSTGIPEPKYQWQFEGKNIRLANSSVLLLTNVTAAHAGRYRVIISNFIGTTISEETLLTVEDTVFALDAASITAANGNLRFTTPGTATQKTILEASRSLQPSNWIPIWTNDPPHSIDYTEPTPHTQRFYRARKLEN
jgi:hypothetical protein